MFNLADEPSRMAVFEKKFAGWPASLADRVRPLLSGVTFEKLRSKKAYRFYSDVFFTRTNIDRYRTHFNLKMSRHKGEGHAQSCDVVVYCILGHLEVPVSEWPVKIGVR